MFDIRNLKKKVTVVYVIRKTLLVQKTEPKKSSIDQKEVFGLKCLAGPKPQPIQRTVVSTGWGSNLYWEGASISCNLVRQQKQ